MRITPRNAYAAFVLYIVAVVLSAVTVATGFLCHKDDYTATVTWRSFRHEEYRITVVVDDIPGLVVHGTVDFAVWRSLKIGDKMTVRMTPRGTYKRITGTQLEAP